MTTVIVHCSPEPEFPVTVRHLGRDASYVALIVDEVTIMSADNDILGFANALERAAEEIRLQAIYSAAITDAKIKEEPHEK